MKGVAMRRVLVGLTVMSVVLAVCGPALAESAMRRLPLREYRDKMMAGWIGQMAGVAWGAPTEFGYIGRIIPEDSVPVWQPGMINGAFVQDDLYVEMTFLHTLEQYGLDVSINQTGIDFANSQYSLWHANRDGRDQLRRGIAPPESGHPQVNKHADDIDYQIEADFSGLIAPGLPNLAIALGEKFGRLMVYGDGLYGGQFIGGMYAAAFFENGPIMIVEAGLRCIPPASQYAEAIRDVLLWYRDDPNDWEKTWNLVNRKYHLDPDYSKFSCGAGRPTIDAKLNGAYVVMGLLFGNGDPEKTIRIAMRCGQDSDCNPSNAAGVLFTSMGLSRLPEQFKSQLNEESVFSHTAYDFPGLVKVCEQLARLAVAQNGGRIELDESGEEILVIPVQTPRPSRFEQSWNPGPFIGVRFSEEERAQILEGSPGLTAAFEFKQFAPEWELLDCSSDENPGLRSQLQGRQNVFVTHPPGGGSACTIRRKAHIPFTGKTILRLVVGHDPDGDWILIVRVDGEEVVRETVGERSTTDGWMAMDVDLSAYAGKTVLLELLNQANGWAWETGYWAEIELQSD